MNITPFILGSGKAASAILEALRVIEIAHPEIHLSSIQKLKRGQKFSEVIGSHENPVLFIANPHALHAQAIQEGEKSGFKLIVCEKPAAISEDQIRKLQQIQTPVAVLHVYRQMWGIQTLKKMIDDGEFGEIIAIEGRYWQSSSAQKALLGQKTDSWKNDVNLSGESDVMFDIASHWVDAAIFLKGLPNSGRIWKSYVNSEAPHRDTHVQLNLHFNDGSRGMASISKTVHGSPNHFEINVIGSKKYGCWKFLEPDILEISSGSSRTFITKSSSIGSGHWPHHGLGWVEGYVEIIYQAIIGGKYPTLKENLDVMSFLIQHTSQ